MSDDNTSSPLAILARKPDAAELVNKLMYEALQPLTDKDPTALALRTGRRNLAVELLNQMEIIK